MAEHRQHQVDDEPDWVLIAQAEGIVSARDRISITEAAAALRDRAQTLDMAIDQLAKDLVRSLRPSHGA